MVDTRPLLATSLLERLSVMVGSPEELGLLLEMAALFEELPFLEVRPLSESGCCNIQADLVIVLLWQLASI